MICAKLRPFCLKLPVGDGLHHGCMSSPQMLLPLRNKRCSLLLLDTMVSYCIVIGVVLTVLALIGLVASCYDWHTFLQIVSRFK